MRALARVAMWLGTFGVPFVIACAYGVPVTYSKTGKVIDADTHEGITGIQVTCKRAGAADVVSTTTVGGDVILDTGSEQPCDTYEALDVDGDANGGRYAPASLPGGSGGFTLLMKKAP
ncbi:MAG TPA: hypothetical protein VGK67_10975 [Myxococcales bacterium]